MAKYTYTYFMKQIEDKGGSPGVEFWFPDWKMFSPTTIHLLNDKTMMAYIRETLLLRCKFFETMRLRFPMARNYFNYDLPLNVAMQAITVDTESE